jgi:hypothetical protein
LLAAGVDAVGPEQERGEDQDEEFALGAEGVFAEDFKDVRQERDAGAEEDEADDVERIGARGAVVGHVTPGEV